MFILVGTITLALKIEAPVCKIRPPSSEKEGPNSNTISIIGGVNLLLGLPDYGFVVVPRDSIILLPKCSSGNKNGASFETPCGCCLVTLYHSFEFISPIPDLVFLYHLTYNIWYLFQMKPMEYMKIISSMKLDLWVSLADEVHASVTLKRNKASIDPIIR